MAPTPLKANASHYATLTEKGTTAQLSQHWQEKQGGSKRDDRKTCSATEEHARLLQEVASHEHKLRQLVAIEKENAELRQEIKRRRGELTSHADLEGIETLLKDTEMQVSALRNEKAKLLKVLRRVETNVFKTKSA